MRRTRLQILLFALALTFQVLAPIAGNLAVAGTIDLGGVSLKLCQSDKADSSKVPLSHGQHQSCALCQIYCDGVSPVATDVIVIQTQSALWRVAYWRLLDRILPSTAFDYARQARAPPAFS